MWKKKTVSNGENSSDNTTKAQDNFKKALDWETSRLELVEKSEKRAWLCSKILGLCLISTAAAIALMMPLKKTEPYVIRVNQNTGEAAVLAIANEKDIPFSEMMDKYWLNQYVLSRESYDYRTLEHDYLKTRELSLPNVFDPTQLNFPQIRTPWTNCSATARKLSLKSIPLYQTAMALPLFDSAKS